MFSLFHVHLCVTLIGLLGKLCLQFFSHDSSLRKLRLIELPVNCRNWPGRSSERPGIVFDIVLDKRSAIVTIALFADSESVKKTISAASVPLTQ